MTFISDPQEGDVVFICSQFWFDFQAAKVGEEILIEARTLRRGKTLAFLGKTKQIMNKHLLSALVLLPDVRIISETMTKSESNNGYLGLTRFFFYCYPSEQISSAWQQKKIL